MFKNNISSVVEHLVQAWCNRI